MVARALARSTDPTIRAVGYGAAGLAALTGTATAGLAGLQTANDVAYQRRMEAVGQKYGFTPATRGERIASEVKQARQKARGEAANYERPLKGKPAAEAGLPEYKAVKDFAKATQSGFPWDTQFTVKVNRVQYPEFDGDEEILSKQAVVDTRFSRAGMTGQIRRNFYRDKAGDLWWPSTTSSSSTATARAPARASRCSRRSSTSTSGWASRRSPFTPTSTSAATPGPGSASRRPSGPGTICGRA
jgi:hypothetical protein